MKAHQRIVLILTLLAAQTTLPVTVLNLNDTGSGSLRQALSAAPSGGTIDFTPGLNGTIVLTSGQLLLGRNVTITVPAPRTSRSAAPPTALWKFLPESPPVLTG
jgi:hypothetical protein